MTYKQTGTHVPRDFDLKDKLDALAVLITVVHPHGTSTFTCYVDGDTEFEKLKASAVIGDSFMGKYMAWPNWPEGTIISVIIKRPEMVGRPGPAPRPATTPGPDDDLVAPERTTLHPREPDAGHEPNA